MKDNAIAVRDSLPRCLRHHSSRDALDDARDMALFLQEVISAMRDPNFVINDSTIIAMQLYLDLVIDKIEIGSEVYKFPFLLTRMMEPSWSEGMKYKKGKSRPKRRFWFELLKN